MRSVSVSFLRERGNSFDSERGILKKVCKERKNESKNAYKKVVMKIIVKQKNAREGNFTAELDDNIIEMENNGEDRKSRSCDARKMKRQR